MSPGRRTDNVPRSHWFGDDCIPPHRADPHREGDDHIWGEPTHRIASPGVPAWKVTCVREGCTVTREL
jgi:hypothetical protein